MASEDVIELGSSDDDVEPEPKRKRTIPDAMVHIPTNLHGITIKPTTSKGTRSPKDRFTSKVLPKNAGLTVSKVSKLINPLANKNKGATSIPIALQKKCIRKIIQKPVGQNISFLANLKPIVNKGTGPQGVNPVHLFKKLNSQMVINKVTSSNNPLKYPIRINSPKTINNLPSSITVKKGPGVIKPLISIKPVRLEQKQTENFLNIIKRNVKARPNAKSPNDVLTVDLDDDDTGSSTSSPQWYLRPEDEKKPTLEEENNKEPENKNFIEITIEDSPVKPKPKNLDEVSVTIEDSPVKAVAEKKGTTKCDEENSNPTKSPPQSKKKLDYPKAQEKAVIEIEIEPMDVDTGSDNTETALKKPKEKDFVAHQQQDVIVEIEESPMKEPDNHITSTPKKKKSRSPVKFLEESLAETIPSSSEFHPVYSKFIKLCYELENSEDMDKIIEKKVKTYYRQVPKEYTESEQFIDMVSSKLLAMKASPDKMYLFIKDIVDELNMQRKMAKSQPPKTEKDNEAAAEYDNFLYGENSEFDSKRKRQIRKLEKTLKKLHRAIQKLEEQEVDFEDEEDSVYLLTERYKERMMRVHAKFCQLTNTKMPSEPRVQLDPRPGHPAGPAKKLEKWINKKVPIGTPLPFPDFHDVLRCVKEANVEGKLGWNDVDVMEEAQDLFTRCGRKLQRRRQENEWRTAVSRISLDVDPAETHEELRKKLEQNKQIAAKKEVDVFNKFADKQNQLKLEGEEIGDKEAEESPVESEEEEEILDEESLENKHKRKERLKRLLEEKSKKNNDEKENEPTITISNTQVNEEDNEITTKDVEMKPKEDIEIKQNKDDGLLVITNSGDVNEDNKKNTDKRDSKTDYLNEVESDIDELHLLEKLYSENEVNSSTVDSSDSDAPISISDTLDSDNEDEKSVFSIENSSYSESEMNKSETFETEEDQQKNTKAVCILSNKIIRKATNTNTEIECSESGILKKQIQSNNDEYSESLEHILLASSDEEPGENDCSGNKNNPESGDSSASHEHCKTVENPDSVEDTVNLKDDSLTIGETMVVDVNNDNVQQNALDSPIDKNIVDDSQNTNMESNEDVSMLAEEVISLDQTDDILTNENADEAITEKIISTNDNLSSNDEIMNECVSLDDDSTVGDTAVENVEPKSDMQSHNVEKIYETDHKVKNSNFEKASILEQDVNCTMVENIETIDGSMNVDESSIISNETSNDKIDDVLKETS